MTLFDAMAITASGLDAHSARLKISAANMANMATPNYQRQIPVLATREGASFHEVLSQTRSGNASAMQQREGGGVTLLGTVADPTPGKRVYQPQHPQADAEGYITLSNTNPLNEMADAMMANRMYEANLSMFSIIRTMANKAIDAGSGR